MQGHTNSHPEKSHFGPLKILFRTPGVREPPVGNHCLNGINKTSSRFAASCLRKSPTWSSILLQRFKLASNHLAK